MRRHTLAVTLLTAAVGLPLAGCNSKYNDLDAAYRASEARNQEIDLENRQLRSEIELLQNRLGMADTAVGGAESTNAQLRAELLRLREQYRQMEDRFRNLDFAQVNPETDSALRDLAARYPDIIQYDSRRGMLRFASDLTFGLGSADVTQSARDTLAQLARVLNSETAVAYDIQIVGHTDSVPITSATAARHPTNTHLSAHRAISVRDALSTAGVNRTRLQVAGWGEYRPAVPNNPGRQGTAQNRRVEIFLVPSTADMYQAAPTTTQSSQQPQQQRQQAPPSRPAVDPIK